MPDASGPTMLRIDELLTTGSPRLDGEDLVYARMLAEVETTLPPILVHRSSMRVIDGMHRVRAATLRGEDTIEAQFVDGEESEMFILAVRANIAHGLPLSLADRQAAAARIVVSHAHLSDRAIASVVGLSATAVGAIRRCSTAVSSPSNARIGLDGKWRPASGVDGRLRAGEVIAANPDASLREIARAAGIALGTARDVRERMRNGLDPVLPTQRAGEQRRRSGSPDRTLAYADDVLDWPVVRAKLSKDPALRYSEPGRAALHWLEMHSIDDRECRRLVPVVPAHWRMLVARLARANATKWLELASELEYRDQETA